MFVLFAIRICLVVGSDMYWNCTGDITGELRRHDPDLPSWSEGMNRHMYDLFWKLLLFFCGAGRGKDGGGRAQGREFMPSKAAAVAEQSRAE